MHTIVGNHDVYYTTTNEVNSISLLLAEYDNISIYEDNPAELDFNGTKILMCPWITRDNGEKIYSAIKKSKAHILCGHFEIRGFEMMKGIVSDHGMDHRKLLHFETVLSGHYHHPSKYGNIRYLGAQYEMNWSDYGGRRGFYILDTITRELSFVENPNRIHHKLDYDDTDLTIDDISELDTSKLKNCFVKIIVRNRTNPYLYDLFMDKLNDSGAADVKSVENSTSLDDSNIEEMLNDMMDTKDILHSYIDGVDTKMNKVKIKKIIDQLYHESINL